MIKHLQSNNTSLYRTLKLKPTIKQSHLKRMHRKTDSMPLFSENILTPTQPQKEFAILPAMLLKKAKKRNLTSDANMLCTNSELKLNDINLTCKARNIPTTSSHCESISNRCSEFKYSNLITPRSSNKPVKSQMFSRRKVINKNQLKEGIETNAINLHIKTYVNQCCKIAQAKLKENGVKSKRTPIDEFGYKNIFISRRSSCPNMG